MKTVCKKLLSLMLVAILLISAVPMAFATEEAKPDVTVNVQVYRDNNFVSSGMKLTVKSENVDGKAVKLDAELAKKLGVVVADNETVNWEIAGGTPVLYISYDEACDIANMNSYLVINIKGMTTTPNPDSGSGSTGSGSTGSGSTGSGSGSTGSGSTGSGSTGSGSTGSGTTTPCNHSWSAWTVTKPATCTAKGEETRTCSACKNTETREIAATGHTWSEYTITKPATCTEEGSKTRKCNVCNVTETAKIDKIPHNYVNGVCTACGAQEAGVTEFTLTFKYLNASGNWIMTTQKVKDGVTFRVPTPDVIHNKEFDYYGNEAAGSWKQNEKMLRQNQDYTWRAGDPLTYVAQYKAGMQTEATLTVYGVYAADGRNDNAVLLVQRSGYARNNEKYEMYDWLNSTNGKQAIETAITGDGRVGDGRYEWESARKYYTGSDLKTVISKGNMNDGGNRVVYIKLNPTDKAKATVHLYVHLKNSKGEVIDRQDEIILMSNYKVGDYVTLDAAKKAVQTKYNTNSKTTYSKLYDEENWSRKMNGKDPDGEDSVRIDKNATVIHVVLSNATNKSNSKADKTNPKTGDNIDVVFTTMTISAMGLAAVAVLKKRKMI